MDQWWINGAPGRLVDVTDRGLAYGDGLFETIAIRRGTARFLELHLDRLLGGCQRLRIKAPSRDRLREQLASAAAGLGQGVMKLILTRGPGPRGYAVPTKPEPTVALGLEKKLVEPWSEIRVRWCETIAGRSPATGGLKTLGRLDQVLARAEWRNGGIAEGLMCDEDGALVGGTASNVFLVTGGRLLTPEISGAGVRGVMRRVLLQQAAAAGVPVIEGHLTRADVLQADELFLTNALTGMRPVRQLDERSWDVGPVTRRLAGFLAAMGVDECAARC